MTSHFMIFGFAILPNFWALIALIFFYIIQKKLSQTTSNSNRISLRQAGLNLTPFYQEPAPHPLRRQKVLNKLIFLGVVYIFFFIEEE